MDREGEKCIGTRTHGKVVGYREDVDAMGKSSLKKSDQMLTNMSNNQIRSNKVTILTSLQNFYLSSHILLKSSGGSSPTVHFSVKDAGGEQSAGNLLHIRRQHLKMKYSVKISFLKGILYNLGLVGACKGPADIAGSISYVGPNGKVALALVIDQSCQDVWHHLGQMVVQHN